MREAALRVLRVEHPPMASNGRPFEAMVVVYQKPFLSDSLLGKESCACAPPCCGAGTILADRCARRRA